MVVCFPIVVKALLHGFDPYMCCKCATFSSQCNEAYHRYLPFIGAEKNLWIWNIRTWNIHNAGKTLYRDRIVELLLQLENKQQIMQNNVATQPNRMYKLYIGSLCNVAFPLARFTCIMTSQVFVEIWMRWSIALSSAFYTGRKHLWIVFSFNRGSLRIIRLILMF